ncbi:MAG: ribonuclease E/G [Pseudomonadota bacterium]
MTRLIVVEPGPPAVAALVIDGRLEDLLVDPPAEDQTPRIEEVHRVRVRRVAAKQGGAHVKLVGGAKGFLREAKGLAEGDLVVAQVSGHAEPGKPAPLTPRRLHRGRYAILTPQAPGVNVARSIRDEAERARLASIGAARIGEDGPGLILRSAAVGAAEDEIAEDLDDLLALEAACAAEGAPALLTEAPGAEATAWREWGDPDELVREAGAFERVGLWDEVDRLRRPRVELVGGGWMSVEPTSALVAVDVNTAGDLSHDAAAKANRAACLDLPRQLRLRGLGGQIAVDFAPMRKNDRKAVESLLKRAFASDPVQTTLAGWTPLGSFEMLRKRERRPFSEVAPDA